VPLEFLRTEAARRSLDYMVEGQSMTHPAFVFQGYTIWGLTYRILTNFLSIVAA